LPSQQNGSCKGLEQVEPVNIWRFEIWGKHFVRNSVLIFHHTISGDIRPYMPVIMAQWRADRNNLKSDSEAPRAENHSDVSL
jgi:hypothetical protein